MTRKPLLIPVRLKVLLVCAGIGSSATVQAALISSDSFATQAGGAPSYYDTANNGGSLDNAVDPAIGQNPAVGVSGFSGAWDAVGNRTGSIQAQTGVSLTHAMSPDVTMNGSIRGYSVLGGNATLARRVSRALASAPTSDGTSFHVVKSKMVFLHLSNTIK